MIYWAVLHIALLIKFCILTDGQLQNIAVNQTPYSPKLRKNKMFPAIDGKTSTCMTSSAGPRLAVELQKEDKIKGLTIHKESSAMVGAFQISIADANYKWSMVASGSTLEKQTIQNYTFTTSRLGLSIAIMMNQTSSRNDTLKLCELQIWACKDGSFGAECKKKCNCRNNTEVCDKETGYCISGCAHRYGGYDCKQACGTHYECNDCRCHARSCDKNDPSSGKCMYNPREGECAIGYRSIDYNLLCQQFDIAYRKPTLASSEKRKMTSSYAVNGQHSKTNKSEITCFSTSKTSGKPWYQVDFFVNSSVKEITMMLRLGCCQNEINGLNVYLSNTPMYVGNKTLPVNKKQCITDPIESYGNRDMMPGQATITIRCKNVVHGRYLILTRNTGKLMSFCKVKVFQCAGLRYGEKCDKKCTCRNEMEECDKHKGTCRSGCPDNIMGDDCKECKEGWFGNNCKQKCNCKEQIQVCNKTNGYCRSQCVDPRYSLPDCRQKCPSGFFGETCTGKCHCNDVRACDENRGRCLDGTCAAGYKGERCQKPCDRGRYGINCASRCNCLDNTKCNRSHGACTECPLGYTDKENSCNNTCAVGRYGVNCASICNCLVNTTCNFTHGVCPACPVGYTNKESSCNNKCKGKTFGKNCRYRCHCKNSSESCHHVTGKCKTGCADKWTKTDCQTKRFFADKEPVVQTNLFPVYVVVLIAVCLVFVVSMIVVVARFITRARNISRSYESVQPPETAMDKYSTIGYTYKSRTPYNEDDDSMSTTAESTYEAGYSRRTNKSHRKMSDTTISKKASSSIGRSTQSRSTKRTRRRR